MPELAAVAPLTSAWRTARADPLLFAAVFIGTASASLAGGVVGGITALLSIAVVAAVAIASASSQDRTFLLRLGVGSMAVRSTVAGALDVHLRGLNPNGAMFYDDAAYVTFAQWLADYWAGRVESLPSDPSMSNTYVLLIGLIFSFVGPVIVVPRLVNGALATIAGLLTYRTMRNLELPGARWAALIISVFPSVALWSVLVLKDVYVMTFAVVAVWGASEFIRSRNYLWWAPTILSFLALESARKYVFIIVVLAWPLGLLIGLRGQERIRAALVASVIAGALFAISRPFDIYNTSTFLSLAQFRANMALGARTAFVEPMVTVGVGPGSQFIVAVPGATPVPDPRIVIVPIGTQLVIETAVPATSPPVQAPSPAASATAPPTARPSVVIVPANATRVPVRPGDRVIVVASALPPSATFTFPPTPSPTATDGLRSASPAPHYPTAEIAGIAIPLPPASQLRVVRLRPEAPNVIGTPVPQAADEALAMRAGLIQNLTHFPVGLFHVLISPFPLTVSTIQELATVPEMLLWYAAVALGLFGLYRLIRERRYGYAYGLLALGGIGLILSLAEGNVGTLIRHRAMMIPFVVVLAAVGLQGALQRRRFPLPR